MINFKKHLLTIVIAVLCSLFVVSSAYAYPSSQDKTFYMGVYLYDYRVESLAAEEGVDYYTYLEKHLKILKENGVNAVYLGGISQEHFDKSLMLYQKYDIKVIPQLDFAYFQPDWKSDDIMDKAATRAADFINEYADNPNIIAFSIKEEVAHKDVNKLSRYYATILAKAPKARFQLINSNLGAATDLAVPDPVIMGTDRYGFWWETSGGGYLATPRSALNWTREQADRYYWQSAKRGVKFSLVVTQGGFMYPKSSNNLASGGEISYPKTTEAQEELRKRVRKFAEEGRMGWKKFDTPYGTRYNAWKYYRLPQNVMKALAWTGVLQGAKSFYVWSYTPPSKEALETDFKKAVSKEEPLRSFSWITLAGRPGIDNPQLSEFAEASREIRKYENIITQMSRTDEKLIKLDDKNVFASTFIIPGIEGRIVVLHNSNVGTWPGGKTFFKDTDDVRIDDEGNLVGYEPYKEPLSVKFSLEEKTEDKKVYDVLTSDAISKSDSLYSVSIAPGSGTLLFVGEKNELNKIHSLLE